MSTTANLTLKAIGSFHIGGQRKVLKDLPVEQVRLAVGATPRPVDPNGSYVTGQMYVQYFLQQEPVSRWPIVLWHGGGMTGANWETTPDGRPGWLQRLLERGHDVYVCDAVERGRAGWSRWPEIYTTPPLFRTMEEGWDMFRIGPPLQTYADDSPPHAEQQFPVEAFEAFAAQWVPRWAQHEEMTLAAHQALLERLGPCVVVAHSQGGGLVLTQAARRPDLFKAVVALEPSGAPAAADAHPDRPPHLVVWGDAIESHPVWRNYRSRVDTYLQALQQQGAPAQLLDLPEQGFRGNSHFPMMDRNSDDVLSRVMDWLKPHLTPTLETAK